MWHRACLLQDKDLLFQSDKTVPNWWVRSVFFGRQSAPRPFPPTLCDYGLAQETARNFSIYS